jgi:dTDP-D-glucose 4,6-dehydratase
MAKEKLGWEPAIPLEQGLEKTIEYFKEIVQDEPELKNAELPQPLM